MNGIEEAADRRHDEAVLAEAGLSLDALGLGQGGLDWLPPAWLLVLSKGLQVLIGIAGAIFLALGCVLLHSPWSFPLWGALMLLAIALHEAGHVAGTLAVGGRVLQVQVWRVNVKVGRNGLRMRWKRGPREFAGFVQSFPAPDRPLRRQFIATVAGGPFVNLLVAAAAFAGASAYRHDEIGGVLLGFSLFNLALFIGNLLPTRAGAYGSDGLQLWRWLRGVGDDEPQVVMVRIMSELIWGAAIDELDERDMDAMRRFAQPGPFMHAWLRLKHLQHQGEWAQAAAMRVEFETQVAAMPAPVVKALNDFISLARCEVRFAAAMANEAVDGPIEAGLAPDVAWAIPSVSLRLQALTAALQGDAERARRLMREGEPWARDSIDRSLERSEDLIRPMVLARIDALA